jgi:hypothetical protein
MDGQEFKHKNTKNMMTKSSSTSLKTHPIGAQKHNKHGELKTS